MELDPRRLFNQSEKNDLFILADGKCQECGDVLGDGWHADHRIPWSKGGRTAIENGLAKCARCNLRKGDQMEYQDKFKPRSFQVEMLQKANDNYDAGKRKIVAEIFCGGGKTAASQYVANDFYRKGYIDTVVVFTPRLNLCRQYELDWSGKDGIQQLFDQPRMGDIVHRPNKAPILKPCDFGYISTYQSLVSDVALHIKTLTGRRYLLVVDEAQFLGIKDELQADLKATEAMTVLAKKAVFVIVMTGTPFRSDNSLIWNGDYTDPDNDGKIKLDPDIRFTYRMGVANEYLRRFDFRLVNGTAKKLDILTGQTVNVNTQDERQSLYQILTQAQYYEPLVDLTVEQVRYVQQINPQFCGLISANDQAHAKAILAYLKRRHREVRTLLAVSDEVDAHTNLEKFKQGGYDILVTVQMAYIGYSYKPITVVCPLTSIRFPGWLDQFFMRGGRAWSEVTYEQQCLYGIVPDDPSMIEYARRLQQDSDYAFARRESTERESGEKTKQEKIELWQDITTRDSGGIGIDPNGDTNGHQYRRIDEEIKGLRAPISVSHFAALARKLGMPIDFIGDSAHVNKPNEQTKTDREDALKSAIKYAIDKLSGRLIQGCFSGNKRAFDSQLGYSRLRTFLNSRFSVASIDMCNEAQLREMLIYIKNNMYNDITSEIGRAVQ